MADIISITSRLDALRLGVDATIASMLPAAAIITTPADAEADLLARCGETTKLRAVMNAVVEAIMGLPAPEADARQDDLDNATAAYCRAVEQIATIPAVSRAGVLAKAVILRESIEEEIGICGGEVMGDRQHKLAWSLANDLASGHLLSPAPLNPDAALIDLCRKFDDDTRALMRNDALTAGECAGDPTLSLDDDALVPILNRWYDTLYGITALTATTPAGLRAKAGALGHALMQRVAVETKVSFDEQAEDYERLAMSLVRDMAAASV